VESKTLMYLNSQYIVDYLSQHPIEQKTWTPKIGKLAKLNGVGDQCGMPPTPVVYEFLQMLLIKKGLFTQCEYHNHCWNVWAVWLRPKSDKQREGLAAKLYRNFYPSMIDTLHVWSILAETKLFPMCYLDSREDVKRKSDLTVITHLQQEYHIQLYIGTKASQQDALYKKQYRTPSNSLTTTRVELTLDRERNPGNKRWYTLDDFQFLFSNLKQDAIIQKKQPIYIKKNAPTQLHRFSSLQSKALKTKKLFIQNENTDNFKSLMNQKKYAEILQMAKQYRCNN